MADSFRRFLVPILFPALLLAACGGSSSPSKLQDGDNEADADTVERDKDSEAPDESEASEYPLCTPKSVRCSANDAHRIEQCSSDGASWATYRDCGELLVCKDGACLLAADGDGEAEREPESEPDADLDSEPEKDAESEAESAPDGDSEAEREVPEAESEAEAELPGISCPGHPEMVLIDDSNYCIDRYESVLMDKANCTGTAYGQAKDDYPEGFQDCVDCHEDGFCPELTDPQIMFYCPNKNMAPQTTPIYACSRRNVLPSGNLTWYQANKSCVNSGKTLCSYTQWSKACSGKNGWLFPYGDTYDKDKCWQNHDSTTLTGVMSDCSSGYGCYDLSGNIGEWLSDANALQKRLVIGGDYSVPYVQDYLQCIVNDANKEYKNRTTAFDSIGLRCCLTVSD